jgi:hypothetical protein
LSRFIALVGVALQEASIAAVEETVGEGAAARGISERMPWPRSSETIDQK